MIRKESELWVSPLLFGNGLDCDGVLPLRFDSSASEEGLPVE